MFSVIVNYLHVSDQEQSLNGVVGRHHPCAWMDNPDFFFFPPPFFQASNHRSLKQQIKGTCSSLKLQVWKEQDAWVSVKLIFDWCYLNILLIQTRALKEIWENANKSALLDIHQWTRRRNNSSLSRSICIAHMGSTRPCGARVRGSAAN